MSVPRGAASADSPTGRIAETVIMKMGGWLTPSVFRRYAIVDDSDMDEAIQKLSNPRSASWKKKCIAKSNSSRKRHNSGTTRMFQASESHLET